MINDAIWETLFGFKSNHSLPVDNFPQLPDYETMLRARYTAEFRRRHLDLQIDRYLQGHGDFPDPA